MEKKRYQIRVAALFLLLGALPALAQESNLSERKDFRALPTLFDHIPGSVARDKEVRPIRAALSMESFLGTSMNYAAGVEVRFNTYQDILNFVTGVKATFRTLNVFLPEGVMSSIHCAYLSVPAIFRFNVIHKPDYMLYSGAGLEMSVLPVYAYFRGHYLMFLKDRKLARPFNISPKIILGCAYGKYFEVETFVMADVWGQYDKYYFDHYIVGGTPLREYCDNEVYNLSIDPNFLCRMHIGIAIRLSLF